MKRFWQKPLSAALALALTVGLVQGVVFPAKAVDADRPAATGVCGDANGDSTLNLKDLVRTLAEVNASALATTDALFTNWNYAVAEDADVIRDLLIQKDVLPTRDAAMIEDFECGRPAGWSFYAGPTTSVGVEGGNHSLVGAIADEGWLGFENASYSFTQTSALKVTIKQQNPVLLPADSFNIMTTGWKEPASATKIGDDYILTFDEPFTKISSFIIKITGEMGDVTVDNLMTCDPVDTKLADGMKGQAYTVVLPTAEEGTSFTVSYRLKGTDAWNEVVPVEEAYVFTPAEAGTYEVSFEGTKDGKVVYAAIMEFKAEDPDVIWDDLDNYSIGGAGVEKSELSGTPALAVNSGAGTWGYFENLNYNPGKAMDGIIVKMKSVNSTITASTVYLYYDSGKASYAATAQSLGNDEYLFTFGSAVNTVEKFSFEIKAGDTVFISYVKAYYEPQGAEDPVLTDGIKGEPYTVAVPTVEGGVYTVKYRLKGTETWTTFESGNYTFTPATAGTYEVSYLITKDDTTVYNRTLEFKVKDSNVVVDFEDGMPGVKYSGSNANETVVDDGTGNHVLQGQSSGTWMGFQGASIDMGKSVTKLKITITQTGANPVNLTTGMFWLVTDTSGSLYPASVEKNGNEYTLTFGTAFSVLKTFTVNITTDMGRVTFDNISIAD